MTELVKESISHEDRLLSALAYPFWYVVFPLFQLSPEKQKRKFLRYHCYQGLILGLALWGGGIVAWTLASILGRLIIFGLLLYPFLKLAEWVAFGTTVFAAGSAWLGNYVQIPYVTEFVRPFLEEERHLP